MNLCDRGNINYIRGKDMGHNVKHPDQYGCLHSLVVGVAKSIEFCSELKVSVNDCMITVTPSAIAHAGGPRAVYKGWSRALEAWFTLREPLPTWEVEVDTTQPYGDVKPATWEAYALSWRQHPSTPRLWLKARQYKVIAYTTPQLLAVLSSNPYSNPWARYSPV